MGTERERKVNQIKLKKIKSGHYAYGKFQIIKWQPESQTRYLWCLSLDNVGLDDFRTLAQVKAHLKNDEEKMKAGGE